MPETYPLELGAVTWSELIGSAAGQLDYKMQGSFKAKALNTFDNRLDVEAVLQVPGLLKTDHIYSVFL